MKSILLLLLMSTTFSFAQDIDSIKIPKGVVYNYSDNKLIEEAKKTITDNLSNKNDYSLLKENMVVGPQLWKRFKKNKNIQSVGKGKITFVVDNVELEGIYSLKLNDAIIIWEELKKEINEDYKIRKANENELRYYWSVISFDIDEPLLIVETKNHNYILNLLKKQLLWLDEAPRTDNNTTDNDFKIYKMELKSIPYQEVTKEQNLKKLFF